MSTQADVIKVRGESMEPTLSDGCSILMDRRRQAPRSGRIYVVRTDEGIVVKRARRDRGRWILSSDHPDWPPRPGPRTPSPSAKSAGWLGRSDAGFHYRDSAAVGTDARRVSEHGEADATDPRRPSAVSKRGATPLMASATANCPASSASGAWTSKLGSWSSRATQTWTKDLDQSFDPERFIRRIGERLVDEFGDAKAGNTPLGVGTAGEQPVRKQLESVLPRGIAVGEGFVIDSYGGTSRQQDVVLYERDICPVFSINDTPQTTYYPCEGVIAVGQIKSWLDRQSLRDAVDTIASVKELRRHVVSHNASPPPRVTQCP